MPVKVDEWTQKDEEDSEYNLKYNLKNIELNSKSTEWNIQKDMLQITEKRNPQIYNIKDIKNEQKEIGQNTNEENEQKYTNNSSMEKYNSSKIPFIPKSKHIFDNTQSMKIDSIVEDENANLKVSKDDTLNPKKPIDHLFATQKLNQDGVTIVSANQNSDALTAHFNSTWRKSIPSNESPSHEKEPNIRVEGNFINESKFIFI